MSELKLLPCPFCGGDSSIGTITYSDKTVKEQKWKQDTFYKVNCIVCGANNTGLVGFRTKLDAIIAWNARPTDKAIEALKDICNQKLFCDGVAADLRGMGITTIEEAYMQGFLDTCEQIKQTLKELGVSDE